MIFEKNQMNRIIILSITLLLLVSCNQITNPTLEGIEDVKIVEASIKKLEINVNAILNNPNVFVLDLARADLTVLVDGIELAHVLQTFDTQMPANSDFKMPLNIKMDLARLYKDNPLGALSKGMKILNEKQLLIQILGHIKIGKGNAKISVPIDQEELIKL
ncbi:MAG: LEA14-like dessication related protein [Saprospiraceae bacterium]